jgi:glutamate racemase
MSLRIAPAVVIECRMQDESDNHMVANQNPVGVFDSGVGGLSVLHAIRAELPHEQFLYAGDSAYAPYGDRSPAFIIERATTIADFLAGSGAKAVVVACNTATAVAVESLRARFTIPIIAIEPAVKPAASRSRSRVVGVLATTGMLSSPNMGKLLANYGADVEFVIQPCPGLADQVEKGELASDETRALVKRYVRPIIDKGGDIIVLGCTHYPFLRPLIEEIAGPAVDVIDPATPVARELRRRLEAAGLLNKNTAPGTEQFWTTGKVEVVQPIMRQLWGPTVVVAGLKAGTPSVNAEGR